MRGARCVANVARCVMRGVRCEVRGALRGVRYVISLGYSTV